MCKSTIFAVLFAGIMLVAPARAEPGNKITIAVFGDWPYTPNLVKNAPLLVQSINADAAVRRIIFVGDIHSGAAPCAGTGLTPKPIGADGGWNPMIYDIFSKFDASVIYTPGDNEWADCHKTNEKMSGEPMRELASLRSLFFVHPGLSLGKNDISVSTQAHDFDPLYPNDSSFVENVMWDEAGIIFVTLNMPGSNNDTLPWTNGFENPKAQAEEIDQRNVANLHWLDAAFERAQDRHAAAVVIALHADMWESEDGVSAYTPFVQHLAARVESFKKPVLLLNGDSHVFKVDKPLADPKSTTGSIHQTQPVPNLTRISVQGSINSPAEWLRLTVDPSAPDIFQAVNVVYCKKTDSATCE